MSVGNILSNVFGRSPVKNIKKHIAKSHECVSYLPAFFEATFLQDWQKAEELQLKIKKLEEEADTMKREIRLSLPNSLFLPIPRADLLKVITAQDKLANVAKDIAGLTYGRKMVFPQEIKQLFTSFVNRSIDSSAQALKAMNEIDNLIETGFRGTEVNVVEGMINTLEDIESETDSQQIKIRNLLFSIEKDLPPVDVMFLYKIIDRVGDLADKAHAVGSYLELMLAH
ncbi:MAG: TIGR00153 family protein [Endozoicomonadaceae bacterium]|nr:TIGR00153 family protein [Endozoicomonadaceae bacterium]